MKNRHGNIRCAPTSPTIRDGAVHLRNALLDSPTNARIVRVGAAALAVLTVLAVGLWRLSSSWDWWSPTEALLSLGTLVVAGAILIGEAMQDWEGSLPKRLTVTYVNERLEPVMQCRRAYLAGEGDVRQWAQQLGQQMAAPAGHEKMIYLQFLPEVLQSTSIVRTGPGAPFKEYKVTFQLRRVPEPLHEKYTAEGKCPGRHCLVWRDLDDKDGVRKRFSDDFEDVDRLEDYPLPSGE